MKPRSREIQIFSLSMLDVISGALGAFLIIMIVLFPYYKKETIDLTQKVAELTHQLEKTRRQAEAAREQVRQAEVDTQKVHRQFQDAQNETNKIRRELSKTFLVIHISWEARFQDVDLHVVDPSGAEFYWERKTHPNRPGRLSVDTIIGPGNEVWEANPAQPGDYKIYAQLYSKGFTVDGRVIRNNAWPTVKGRVSYKDGTLALPEITLRSIEKNTYIATITVDNDGSVRVSP